MTNMSALKKQHVLSSTSFQLSDSRVVKENEIRIASFIAEHNIPIMVSDHLVELIKTICNSKMNNTQISKMSCGRTKCTAIINNVTGKSSFDILVEKLRCNKFSLLVDESTDKSAIKNLAMVVRFNEYFTIKDEFLSLVPVKNATAEGLYNVIVDFFNEHVIPYKQNLVGFAADSANAMMGRNHSLKTLLIKDIPNLFVIKCVCHSFALCASYACEKIRNSVEKLVRNIFSFLQYSYKRQQEFQKFLTIKPHKLLQPSQTRWLSLNAVVVKVIEQFDALKLYFRIEAFESQSLGASEIHTALSDPTAKLY
ncbi:zinc finger BED domain-containing protein 5-like [Anthonomus grandis grandis]|uniref:zinc finger BED domain-containing protein 5-like n=1 Tax=Anthonomus grandis grandis TaxID=2921223 RepID=UPI0021669869|nr:zinc finger BED domain-containing protein 5-like [Anthonomus grandis grandis]